MDDRTFFDTLHQLWAKTTGGDKAFWSVEEDEEFYDQGPGTWIVYSVDQETQKRTFVASYEREVDADFAAAMAGCLPDLVRRLHAALDEADRLDQRVDDQTAEIAELVLENQGLAAQITELEKGR